MHIRGAIFAVVVLSLIASNSAAIDPGHLNWGGCDETTEPNWHWANMQRLPVWFNWDSFLANDFIDSGDESSYVAAVRYAIHQWNTVSGGTPWLYYAGEKPSPSGSGEIYIAMGGCAVGGVLASAGTSGYCSSGNIANGPITLWRQNDGPSNCTEIAWSTGDLDDTSTVNFTTVLIHEMGHALGLDHSCDCACGLSGACSGWMGEQVMNPTAAASETRKFMHLHAPYSWEAKEVRDLNGQYSHRIANYYSYYGGSLWSEGTLSSETTNAPVGLEASDANGNFVMAWQGTNGANSINTLVGTTKVTLSQNAQLGIALAGKRSYGSTQRMVIALNWGGVLGESSAMDRWVDLAYSTNQGNSWTYQYTSMRSVAKPSISYATANSTNYWVLAYSSRDNRRILVHVMPDSFPLSYSSYVTLQNGGQYVGAIGGVHVECATTSNECQLAFLSDGSGDTTGDNAMRVRVVEGYIWVWIPHDDSRTQRKRLVT